MPVLRIVAFVLGLGIVVSFFLSAIRVSLLTWHIRDWLADLVLGVVYSLFRFGLRQTPDPAARDRVLIYQAPVTLVVLIGAWYVLAILGFTAILWAVEPGAITQSLVISGMSLSTLGSFSAGTIAGQLLSVLEGGIGLGIVALLISFLPAIYTFIQQRQETVSWLAARVGSTPSGSEMLAWFYRTGQMGQLADAWATWEKWFEDLDETHSTLTVLAFFRSFTPARSWVTAAGAVLDAAALVSSSIDRPADPGVGIVLDVGSEALWHIVRSLDVPFAPPLAAGTLHVTRQEYDAACAMLAGVGVPLKPDREQAWHDFAALRTRYEPALVWLAEVIEVSLPPWPPTARPEAVGVQEMVAAR